MRRESRLAYEWSNLLPACAACNKPLRDLGERPTRVKGNQFPLQSGSPRAFGPEDDLALEQRLLLDPCSDELYTHLEFSPLEGRTDKGRTSIEVFHLNQSTKTMRRKAAMDRLLRAHQRRDVEELTVVLGDKGEFCGLLRSFFSNLLGQPWGEWLEEQSHPNG